MKLYFENKKRINESNDEILSKLVKAGFVLNAWYIVYDSGRPVKYSTEIIGPFSSRKAAYEERTLNWKSAGFNEQVSVKKGSEVLDLASSSSLFFDLNEDETLFNWDPEASSISFTRGNNFGESLSKKRMNEDLTSQNNWTIFSEEENSSWSEDTVKQFIYSLHVDSNEMIKEISCTPYNITIYLNDGEDIKSMSDFYRDVFTRGGLKTNVDFDTRFNVILISLPTKELSIIAYIDYVNKLYNILDNYELKLDLYKALTSGHWN